MSRSFTLALILLAIALPSGAEFPTGMSARPLPFAREVARGLPDPADLPVQLVLDDDTAEAVFGFGGTTGRQFLWFNRFASPEPFLLTEIWVLFPAGTDVEVGDEVELLVYRDDDTDPANGAELLTSHIDTVQAVDGVTFSVYPLSSLLVGGGGEVLLGVVNRYFETGVDTPPTEPAALDTTTGQDRSYVAYWAGDPPSSPDLATVAGVVRLDGTNSGNFMIRGFGINPPAVAIPTLSTWGLAALALVLLLIAATTLRRGEHAGG